jgi:SH3-like domain-containing protein
VSKGRAAFVALIVLTSTGSVAMADPWKTRDEVELRAKPGEKEAVLTKVPAGTEVTVERAEGRWMRVKVGGQVGYLARTVLVGGPPPVGGSTGTWSSPRHADPAGPPAAGLFLEVVATQGTLRRDPAPTAPTIATIAKGGHLAIIDATRADWVHVRDPQGADGWIARAEVDNGASSVAVTGVDLAGASTTRPVDVDDFLRRPPKSLTVRVDAGVGYRSFAMDFTSTGNTGFANYLVSAAAPTLDVAGDLAHHGSGRLVFGADVRLRLGTSSPGIDYPGPSGPPGKIAFSLVDTDLGGRIGVRVGGRALLALRAGAHYDAFLARNVENVGMLPRERLLGATVGARVDLTPPRSRVAVTGTFDYLVAGGRKQTPGLEDGTQSSAHALWAGVAFRYALGQRWSLLGAFHFGRASTTWTGKSVRDPSVNGASRVDSSQLVQLGLSAEL